MLDKASDVVTKRGGTKSLEEDAGELAGIAKGGGTLWDASSGVYVAISTDALTAFGKSHSRSSAIVFAWGSLLSAQLPSDQ